MVAHPVWTVAVDSAPKPQASWSLEAAPDLRRHLAAFLPEPFVANPQLNGPSIKTTKSTGGVQIFVKRNLPTVFNCLCYFPADKRLSRTPRRTQQPKTLNTPEDSTYYTLIHVSQGKDADWFQILSTTKLCNSNCFHSRRFLQCSIDWQFCVCVLVILTTSVLKARNISLYKAVWKKEDFFSTFISFPK